MKKQISAEVVAHSVNEFGQPIASLVVVIPRIVLAELNTHRMLSRNSASSRAIPFKKMLKMVQEDPFIPIAFQKDHSGMQGTEYLDPHTTLTIAEFAEAIKNLFDREEDEELLTHYTSILSKYFGETQTYTLTEWWLIARDKAVESAVMLACFGVTKQLCNRILEPFMWHTVIVTATELENFFHLRCPQYEAPIEVVKENGESSIENILFRSRKDLSSSNYLRVNDKKLEDLTEVDWLRLNKSGAEIHIARAAECMWDAMNESKPKELKSGEWHMPFGDKFDEDRLLPKDTYGWYEGILGEEQGGWTLEGGEDAYYEALSNLKVRVATARCARVSYMNYEGKDDYEADIKLYDRLSSMGHWSPFEHCAQAMSKEDLDNNLRIFDGKTTVGVSGNFEGYTQLRKTFTHESGTENIRN